ncbi:hypothetical protein VTN77DRAFT_3503 [Rasamsonia byssochlamydoides]|uniref:uncharacterized protein n=1 Tax=Rasamsonia byssochlamydoides TaxID=89139 RepID=UPI003744A571
MTFSEADIPDLSGKIIIITGGNSGIGKQTVAVLASKGAKVYLAARSEEKYRQALADIHETHPATKAAAIEFLKLDLSTAAGAKAAAEDFKAREQSLHILYNNAGVMGTAKGKLSGDGYEYQWAVNVFGPFVLTYHLLPLLIKTAARSPPGDVRIINTASSGAKQAPKSGIPLDDPTVGASPPARTPFQCYGQSKIGVILLTRQLARRYPRIWSFAPHPSPVQSELMRELGIPRAVKWVLDRIVFKPVQYGALTQLFAGTSSTLSASQNGSYLVPLGKVEDRLPHPQCADDQFGEKVWEWNINAMRKAGAE